MSTVVLSNAVLPRNPTGNHISEKLGDRADRRSLWIGVSAWPVRLSIFPRYRSIRIDDLSIRSPCSSRENSASHAMEFHNRGLLFISSRCHAFLSFEDLSPRENNSAARLLTAISLSGIDVRSRCTVDDCIIVFARLLKIRWRPTIFHDCFFTCDWVFSVANIRFSVIASFVFRTTGLSSSSNVNMHFVFIKLQIEREFKRVAKIYSGTLKESAVEWL